MKTRLNFLLIKSLLIFLILLAGLFVEVRSAYAICFTSEPECDFYNCVKSKQFTCACTWQAQINDYTYEKTGRAAYNNCRTNWGYCNHLYMCWGLGCPCAGGDGGGGVPCGGCSAGGCQGKNVGASCGTGTCKGSANTCAGGGKQCRCVRPCVPGVPGMPTLDPGDGESVRVVSSQATVKWTRPNLATSGELELYPASLRGTAEPCSHELAHCDDDMLALSFTFSYEPVEYYYRVRAINECPGQPKYVGEWAEATFTIVGPITGQVRLDRGNNAQMSGGRCALIGAGALRPGEGSQVVVDGSYSSPVGGGRWDLGLYEVKNVPVGPLPVVLEPGDSKYSCTCPDNCRYIISAPIPQPIWTGLYFFVTDQEVTGEAWFQGVGGNFHADGGNLRVNIPSSCSGVCEPYLITEDDVSGATGAVSYDGGGLDLGDFGMDNISENDDDWQLNTSYEGLQTKYNYFARILEDDPDGIKEWFGGKPADGETGVYKGDGISRISGVDWTIDDETVVVLLVPNNLVIDVNIDVEEGGFLAIISSGDITIGDDVTNVEGVYIADGVINTCELLECGNISGGETVADRQLVLEGIFTGWGGVDLRRDFGTTDNNTNPAEVFVYRPDLQTNAYEYLLRPYFTWEEVAP